MEKFLPQSTSSQSNGYAWFQIIEQPNSTICKFNYNNNDKVVSTGIIFGENNTDEELSFLQVRVFGYRGPVIIIISFVSNDAPHRYVDVLFELCTYII